MSELDKDIILKYEELLNEVRKNKAIASLSITDWEELNGVAKRNGFGSTCNCSSGRISTLLKLAQKVKEIKNERQIVTNTENLDTAKKTKSNRGKSSKRTVNA